MSDHMPRKDAELPPRMPEAATIAELRAELTRVKADSAAAFTRGMERAERIAVGVAESCAGNVTVYSPPMAGAHEELRLLHTGGEQSCWQVVGAIRAEAAAIRAAKGEPE